jgi:hypothetical protein
MDNPETHVALKKQDMGQRHGESRNACSTLHTRYRTKTWIIQRHTQHLTHKTHEKDMDNPETHVALNTQDTGQRHG